MNRYHDKTAPERVARDKAKKLAAGMVRVTVWIPEKDREELLSYARDMRQESR